MKKALSIAAALAFTPALAFAQTGSTTSSTTTTTRTDDMKTGSMHHDDNMKSGDMNKSGDMDKSHDMDKGDMKPTSSAQVLQHLHRTNQTEIDMGKLAKDNSQTQQVKDYGDKLVTDHKKADDKVKDAAKKMNVDLDKKDDALAKHDMSMADRMKDHLKQEKGAQFDRMFLHHMIEDHRKDIEEVKTAMTQYPELKPTLSEILPDLQSHLDSAKTLMKNMGAKNMGRSPNE